MSLSVAFDGSSPYSVNSVLPKAWEFIGLRSRRGCEMRGFLTVGGLTVAALLPGLSTLGQVGQTWAKVFPQRSIACDVRATNDGGLYVAGYTLPASGTLDAMFARFDASGAVRWEYLAGAYLVKVLPTEDGGSIGAIRDSGIGLIKSAADGTCEWYRKYDLGFTSASPFSISPMPDGGFLIGASIGVGNDDFGWIVRTAESGDILWQKRLSAPSDLWKAEPTPDGGIMVLVWNRSPYFKMWVAKLSGTGDILWQRSFQNSWLHDFVSLADGRTAFSGIGAVPGYGPNEPILVVVDPAGQIVWQRAYPFSLGDTGWSAVRPATDGGFILGETGITTAFYGSGSSDVVLLHVDPSGTPTWAHVFGGSDYETLQCMTSTPDGGYAVGANTRSFSLDTLGPSMMFFKVDENGNLSQGCGLQRDIDVPVLPTALQFGSASLGLIETSAIFASYDSCQTAPANYATNSICSPPVLSSVTQKTNPFRLVVEGSNLQKNVKVYIDGHRWTQLSWRNTGKVVLDGGAVLKAKFPRGWVPFILFVNPDGGQAGIEWQRF